NRPAGEGPFSALQPDDGTPRATIPRAAILRFRLSELPQLAGQLTRRAGEPQGHDVERAKRCEPDR
ncbi:hypothetical protein ABTE40_20615, partial [Acinetobacter baumannii]